MSGGRGGAGVDSASRRGRADPEKASDEEAAPPSLIFRLERGRMTLIGRAPMWIALRGARVIVRYRRVAGGGIREWAPQLQSTDTGAWARDERFALVLELEVRREDDGLRLSVTLHNRGPTPLVVHEIAVLEVNGSGECLIGAGCDRWAVFRNGYQSWSGTGALAADAVDRDPLLDLFRISTTDIRRRASERRGDIYSDLFTVIANRRSGEALCLGFLDGRAAFSGVRVVCGPDRRLSAAVDLEDRKLRPGESVTSPPLWIGAGFDAVTLLEKWAAHAGREMEARVPLRSPSGWCSWYDYYSRVREIDILENLERLRRPERRFACEYVQLDDGYQAALGDWRETNAKFPHGLAWLAKRIREAGFTAGLWLAPFIARREARLFREHPDWFVRTSGDRPRRALWNPVWGWLGWAYALDTSHPAVLEWLHDLARTLVQEWGYRLLKLDFLFAAALPGLRHDRSVTRARALRMGLDAIRAGAGDDAFLLGCGCPLGPAVGVVDAMRIGPDVAPFWSLWATRTVMRDRHGVATKHAVRNILTRAFMHRRLWLNDPDCLMVRARRTRLSFDEVRTLASVIGLTDGMPVLSDRLDDLPEERRRLLEEIAGLRGRRVRIADLLDSDLPEQIVARGDEETLLGILNANDRAEIRRVDLGRAGLAASGARDFWTGERVYVDSGWLDAGAIPAHGCRVFKLDSSPPSLQDTKTSF